MTRPSSIRAASARARCPESSQAASRTLGGDRPARGPEHGQQAAAALAVAALVARGRAAGCAGGRPCLSQAHCRLTGQSSQRGRAAVHTSAPSSITPTDHCAASPPSSGSSDSASRTSAAVCAGRWQLIPGHEPGEDAPDVRVEHGVPLAVGEARHGGGGIGADSGQAAQLLGRGRYLAAIAGCVIRSALACSRTARRGYPSRSHCRTASAGVAAASAAGSGQRLSQAAWAGSTRLTGVCCSMISLTRIDHGVASGWRHGRSRALAAYQRSTGAV